jgi:hypothetical protein
MRLSLRKGSSIFFALVVLVFIGYLVGQSTGTPPFPSFGDPTKAQFYTVLLDPQSGAGAYVQHQASAEVSYLIPGVTLGAAGISSAITILDTASGTYSVAIMLNGAGASIINQFAAANGSTALLALVWNNEVVSILAASQFNTNGGQTVVAVGQTPGDATAIASGLTIP